MEILLWLVPPVVVTLLAMAWVGWMGREGRGEVDPEVAVRRMAAALSKPGPQAYAVPPQARERSTGIAVRPSRRPATAKPATAKPGTDKPATRQKRAS